MTSQHAKKPKMDWNSIVAALHRKGMTLTELSKRNGLHKNACAKVKNISHFGAQDAIATFLDEKPEDLWPSRYPKGGPRILDTKKYPPVDSQKDVATADKRAVA